MRRLLFTVGALSLAAFAGAALTIFCERAVVDRALKGLLGG